MNDRLIAALAAQQTATADARREMGAARGCLADTLSERVVEPMLAALTEMAKREPMAPAHAMALAAMLGQALAALPVGITAQPKIRAHMLEEMAVAFGLSLARQVVEFQDAEARVRRLVA